MIEAGLPVPPIDEAVWPKALVCVAIGAGVPVAAFGFTWLASFQPPTGNEIWFVPSFVSVVAVFAGVSLAARLFSPASGSDRSAGSLMKVESDPDAYDVAGRRG